MAILPEESREKRWSSPLFQRRVSHMLEGMRWSPLTFKSTKSILCVDTAIACRSKIANQRLANSLSFNAVGGTRDRAYEGRREEFGRRQDESNRGNQRTGNENES